MRRLYETLQLEIIGVIESLGQLRESPEYALWQISEKKAGVLDELAAERAKALEKERAELEKEAERLAGEFCGRRVRNRRRCRMRSFLSRSRCRT